MHSQNKAVLLSIETNKQTLIMEKLINPLLYVLLSLSLATLAVILLLTFNA